MAKITKTTKAITSTSKPKKAAKAVILLTPGQKAAATKALTGIQFAAGKKAAETKARNKAEAEKLAMIMARKAKTLAKAKTANRKAA